MADNKTSNAQITVAIIGAIGLTAAAIFANWDKIFPLHRNHGAVEEVDIGNSPTEETIFRFAGPRGYDADGHDRTIYEPFQPLGSEILVRGTGSAWRWRNSSESIGFVLEVSDSSGVLVFRGEFAADNVPHGQQGRIDSVHRLRGLSEHTTYDAVVTIKADSRMAGRAVDTFRIVQSLPDESD